MTPLTRRPAPLPTNQSPPLPHPTPPGGGESARRAGEGRRFGDYELLEELGRGGMGIVYRARQISIGRLVAVKLLRFGPLAGDEFVKRLRMEAAAAGCLRHPNIVAIHEVGIHQDQHYLAMDYVAGPNLAALAGNLPLPPKRAASLTKAVAEAIHYAHERGVLHRDLKPSNILVEGEDQPRITDFGLAKLLNTEHCSLITDHSDSKTGSNQLSVFSDQFSIRPIGARCAGRGILFAGKPTPPRIRRASACWRDRTDLAPG